MRSQVPAGRLPRAAAARTARAAGAGVDGQSPLPAARCPIASRCANRTTMDHAAELPALLKDAAAFAALDDAQRAELAAALQCEPVRAGDVLLRQGAAGDALFVVGRGRFTVHLRRDDGTEAAIGSVGPGEVLGELQLVVGGAASATVVAASDALVWRLPRPAFDALCRQVPALLDAFARLAARRLQRRQLLAVLPAMFGTLDAAMLETIERQLTWRTLPRGEVLFRKGDAGDAWYVVTSGRVAVVEPAQHGQPERLLSEVGRGEGVGEMALVTGQPRSATVYALRDAELACFPASLVARLSAAVPQVAQAMLRGLAQRITQQSGAARSTEPAGLTLTLLPTSAAVDLAGFAQRLTTALRRFGSARQVDSGLLREIGVDHEAALRAQSHPGWMRVGAWLDEQGAAHRFLVLLADATPSAWSARALGQADRVIVVGDAHGSPAPGPLEQALLPPPPAQQPHDVRRLLVLLHRDGARPPRDTARWLDARAVQEHLHVRLDRSDDIERLARRLAGRAVALALSGGGARCCAHIGVARALREHGIPIDLVAGTSAGSLTGYLAAAGVADEAMRDAARRFHEAGPFKGYTLPLFSLLDGDRLTRALQAQCGDAQLEDLWLPLVAVSSNLTRRAVELHTRGPAWQALRASCSLPGLVQPVIRDGELLVDGGLSDNLPVDVARERLAGRVIAVDVTADLELHTGAAAYPSPWLELPARMVRGRAPAARVPPGLLEVMMHSLLLASLAHTRRMRHEADLCLRPDLARFGLLALARHDEIIEAGYRHALQRLPGDAQRLGL